MKIQLKGLTAELTKAITEASKKRKELISDWYEDHHLDKLNKILDGVGANITLMGHDDGVLCMYYSGKIHQTIILEWDTYSECKTAKELAEHLVSYNDQARELEAKLENNLP